eukprot:TRINITY_DN9242_c0_g1_i2.p1 TRINITY_DN9242_c0_g1~~TRINITY_DN9242_c0_g1_i2.p1  ORF type:complete len:368 (+),score=61.09 TRINITY_DN9242_c0_g1_i2:66-1169(+)
MCIRDRIRSLSKNENMNLLVQIVETHHEKIDSRVKMTASQENLAELSPKPLELAKKFLSQAILKENELKSIFKFDDLIGLLYPFFEVIQESPKILSSNQYRSKMISMLEQVCKICELELPPLKGFLHLAAKEFEHSEPLVLKLTGNNNQNKVIMYNQTLRNIINQNTFKEIKVPNFGSAHILSEWKEIMGRVVERRATSKDLFRLIDLSGDGNGYISKGEFAITSRRLGNDLSEHRINEIIAEVKKKSLSTETNDLDPIDFEQAISYLSKKNVELSLNSLGINYSTLLVLFIILAFLLFLLIMFIFFGINAFTVGGSFGAVINSSITVIGGVGMGQVGSKDSEEILNEEDVQQTVRTTNRVITSKHI